MNNKTLTYIGGFIIKKLSKILILVITTALITITFLGCSNNGRRPLRLNATDLMYGITARQVEEADLSDDFISSKANFSIDLFRQTLQKDENTLISATSVLLALAMTANGAGGETLNQMEAMLGGGMPITELNRYLYSFVSGLFSGERSRIDISNSIWFREDGITVNPEFLQTNADYFGANAYAAPFDQTTVDD